jgi:hypothetical protein
VFYFHCISIFIFKKSARLEVVYVKLCVLFPLLSIFYIINLQGESYSIYIVAITLIRSRRGVSIENKVIIYSIQRLLLCFPFWGKH